MHPTDRRYTREHEWVKLEDGQAVVGITHFAQEQLGDIVFVELPAVGARVEQHKPFGVIESVKTASDLYSPVTGEIVEINPTLVDLPQQVNDSPYELGWMIKVRPDDPNELDTLLTADEYAAQFGE